VPVFLKHSVYSIFLSPAVLESGVDVGGKAIGLPGTLTGGKLVTRGMTMLFLALMHYINWHLTYLLTY